MYNITDMNYPPSINETDTSSENKTRDQIPAGVALGEMATKEAGSFYGEKNKSETERLKEMADLVDPFSLESIQKSLNNDLQDKLVVDIGAGDSTTLGQKLEGLGVVYVPVDKREEAVALHREAGFEAVCSMATNINLESDQADHIHSRFTFGWLNKLERQATIKEMIRIAKPDATISIIDYNWDKVDGPPPFMDAINEVVKILESAGFDTSYGDKLDEEFSEKLDLLDDNIGDVVVSAKTVKSPLLKGSLIDCLPIFEHTTSSIFEFLDKAGLDEEATCLRDKVSCLQEYVKKNPNEEVQLPEVVVRELKINKQNLQIDIDQQRDHLSSDVKQEKEPFIEGVDFKRVGCKGGPFERVVIATSKRLIDLSRHLQAKTYFEKGLSYEESIENGFFIEEIDPLEQVERSVYAVLLNDEGNDILGGIRYIKQNENGLESLPTVHKVGADAVISAIKEIIKNKKDTNKENIRIDKKDMGRVIEASGLFSRTGRPIDALTQIIGIVKYGKEQGCEYAIMDSESGQAKLFQRMFGKDNMYIIGDPDGSPIQYDYADHDKRYVVMMIDVKSFREDILDHSKSSIAKRQKEGKKPSALTEHLRDLCSAD